MIIVRPVRLHRGLVNTKDHALAILVDGGYCKAQFKKCLPGDVDSAASCSGALASTR